MFKKPRVRHTKTLSFYTILLYKMLCLWQFKSPSVKDRAVTAGQTAKSFMWILTSTSFHFFFNEIEQNTVERIGKKIKSQNVLQLVKLSISHKPGIICMPGQTPLCVLRVVDTNMSGKHRRYSQPREAESHFSLSK